MTEVKLSTRLFRKSSRFQSVKDVLAVRIGARSGDELAAIGAKSEQERVAAKMLLADLTLAFQISIANRIPIARATK